MGKFKSWPFTLIPKDLKPSGSNSVRLTFLNGITLFSFAEHGQTVSPSLILKVWWCQPDENIDVIRTILDAYVLNRT